MTAREWLNAAQVRADAATKGPWEYAAETEEIVSPDGGIVEMTWPGRNRANATFIAHARTDAPALVAALRAVLHLHAPVDALMNPGRHERLVKVCAGCGTDDGTWRRHPCPTVRAITAALDGAS